MVRSNPERTRAEGCASARLAKACVQPGREMADAVSIFMSIGLSEQKAKETLKNEALSSTLKKAIEQVHNELIRIRKQLLLCAVNLTSLSLENLHDSFFTLPVNVTCIWKKYSCCLFFRLKGCWGPQALIRLQALCCITW